MRVCVAMTGASGSLYALRLVQALVGAVVGVDVIVSKAAQLVFATETPLSLPGKPQGQAQVLREYVNANSEQLRVFAREDWMAPWASGSGQRVRWWCAHAAQAPCRPLPPAPVTT